MKTRSSILAVVSLLVFHVIGVGAQEPVQIQNRWKPLEYIHVEQPLPASGAIQPGWQSARWILEPVPGGDFYRIRNQWRSDSYLHVENGSLDAGMILPGWHSAQWSIERAEGSYIRIRNRWKPEQAIHNQNGSLSSGAIEPGWWSAQWTLVPGRQPSVMQVQESPPATQPSGLPVNDMRLFQARNNGTVGMVLVRYTNQIKTMMDLQVRPGDRIYFFPQRLPDANRDGISFNPDNPEIGGQVFAVQETSPSIVLDRPMPMIRNRRNDTFAFVVEVFR